MHIHRKFLFNFFLWEECSFLNLEIWPKLKIQNSCQCHWNCVSAIETAQQNLVKLGSIEGHNMLICIFTGNTDLIFLKSNLYPFLTLAKIICENQMELVFCSIAPHLCLELPFVVYSILQQCWSVGYMSLLTLSFI